jgi:MYXO-CTERM domain-containing protein
MRRALWSLVSLLLVGPAQASAQATLVNGFGGPADFGTIEVFAGDDEDSIVDVTPAFPMGLTIFGQTYNSIRASSNGLVSLGGPRNMAPINPMPVGGNAFIAAYSYDMLPDGAPAPVGANRVYAHVIPGDAISGGRVYITWYLVRATRLTGPERVSAQLEIRHSAAAGVTTLVFRYNLCEWSIAGSGTLHAQAGFNRGDDALGEFVALPGSGTAGVRSLCTGTNNGSPGVWQLVLRGPSVEVMCGDGIRQTGELCDDGNTMDGDGCPATCQGAACGNGIMEAGEACDDGDLRDGDGCSSTCMLETVPMCGDGTQDITEECDDGNTSPRDGCDGSCRIERAPDGGEPLFDAGRRDGGTGRDTLVIGGGGCSCRVGTRASASLSGVAFLGLAMMLMLRRRR